MKFYRDYSIADFLFCAFITLIIGYGIFQPNLPLGVCEGLSQHPDVMRDMTELGLSPENCERWFKRASLAFLAVMLIVLVARVSILRNNCTNWAHLSTATLLVGSWYILFSSLPSPTHTCHEQQQHSTDPHSIFFEK